MSTTTLAPRAASGSLTAGQLPRWSPAATGVGALVLAALVTVPLIGVNIAVIAIAGFLAHQLALFAWSASV